MNKTYIITESWFKDNTPVNLNVEPKLLNMGILDAQILHLQNLLGSKLYNKIITLIQSGSISTPYKELLDNYILDVVKYYTLVEILPYISYKIMNKSVTQQNSDNSTPITTEDLKFYQETFRNKAQFYGQRLADHLLNNSSLYPEYLSGLSIEDIKPETNSYFSGMVLDEDEFIRQHRRIMGYNDGCIDLNW